MSFILDRQAMAAITGGDSTTGDGSAVYDINGVLLNPAFGTVVSNVSA
jgi:hypothetical protein